MWQKAKGQEEKDNVTAWMDTDDPVVVLSWMHLSQARLQVGKPLP